jgi:hypothetical protein
MAKPKTYVGDTYSNPFDHGGKDYRWDEKKQEYVISRGESPMASMKRSWDKKIVPLAKQTGKLAQQYGDRQIRLSNEAIGISPSKDPKSEAVNYFSKWIEDPSIPDQIRYPLEQASLSMQNLFELTNEENATLSYVNAFKADPSTSDFKDTQPRTWQNDPTQVSDKPSTGDLSMFEDKKQNETTKPKKQNKMKTWDNPIYGDERDYDRTDPTQRRDRRLENKLVEGSPLEKFKLEKERQTGENLSTLFDKEKPKISDLLKIFKK